MKGHLFQDIPESLPEELFQTLIHTGSVKVERILSRGHCSGDDEWYDQSWNEWVVLLSGAARLVIDGQSAPVEMLPGDYLQLPAGTRHRVDWTAPDVSSVWLAVHYTS